MASLDVLLINGESQSTLDAIRIVEDASSYFPRETWDDVECLAEITLEHDVTIATGGESFGAFVFEKLTRRIERMKHVDGPRNLLLGITPSPIVAVYCFFDAGLFKRTVHLVHDYVDERVGVVSLFQVKEQSSRQVVAHGLGHSRGLRHHWKPIDIMYSGLLREPTLRVEGFCRVCLNKLRDLDKP